MTQYRALPTNDPRDSEPQTIEGVTVSRATWSSQVFLNLGEDLQLSLSETQARSLGVEVPSRVVELAAKLTEEQLQVLASAAPKTGDLDLDQQLQRAAIAALDLIEQERALEQDFQKGITEVEATSDPTA